VCVDENCTPGVDIDPGRGFNIQEIQGQGNGDKGKIPKHWLDGAMNGNPITRTRHWSHAGIFLITKWPGGKYCLTSFGAGVGPTYSSDKLGATMTLDDQSCIPMTLVEVPCDIRTKANNCIWGSGNGTQTSTSGCAEKPGIVNASMPVAGSGVSDYS